MDELNTIKEKFIAWNPDCKDWSFDHDDALHDGKYPITVIYFYGVFLFAQIYPCECCDEMSFFITDAGGIKKMYEEKKLQYLFISPLSITCMLKDFHENMDCYFDVFNFAIKKTCQKNEK